jgi:hypothetical protein
VPWKDEESEDDPEWVPPEPWQSQEAIQTQYSPLFEMWLNAVPPQLSDNNIKE